MRVGTQGATQPRQSSAIASRSSWRHLGTMSSDLDRFGRLMLFLSGGLAAGGIAAAAASSHSGDGRVLGAVALVSLTQAPALLAFGLIAPPGWLLRAGAIAIAVGACLFSGVLALHQILDIVILPMSAPLGAVATVAGWILVAIAGLTGRR